MSARDEGYLPWIAASPEGLPVRRHHGCARRGRRTDTDQLALAPPCPPGKEVQ
jgi:hypothetical protein